MDQSRAINALGPFIALAKSATSPRAAADLVTQATSAPNTYIFSELLQQPNVQALAGSEKHGSSYELLKIFSWGTWRDYKDAQAKKLRLLSLLTIASRGSPSPREPSLSYASLMAQLDIPTALELEQIVITAIYADLIAATLDPASQMVVITSIAPLRDLAPGSVATMISELTAWKDRCNTVLADIDKEIAKAKSEAQKRNARETRTEKQVRAAAARDDKGGATLPSLKSVSSSRMTSKRDAGEENGDPDAMDVDGSHNASLGGTGKKRSAGGGSLGGLFGRLNSKGGR